MDLQNVYRKREMTFLCIIEMNFVLKDASDQFK